MAIIERKFYSKHSLELARNILGQIMCVRQADGSVFRAKVVEAEAYRQDEPSCHAYKGITKRSQTLFSREGTLYVYFTYGMYHCANVVSEREGYGSGVLIRALEPLDDTDKRAMSGPGKLCRTLNITRDYNGLDVTDIKSPVFFEYGENIPDDNVVQSVRVGIKLAADLPWRFYVKNSKSVSKK